MQRWILLLLLVGLIAGAYLFVKDRQFRGYADQKEAYVVSLQCAAVSAVHELEESSDDREYGLEGMLELGMIDESFLPDLMEVFPNGLDYRVSRAGYAFAEPKECRVSWFHKDRLVASDEQPAHWEKSGKRATK